MNEHETRRRNRRGEGAQLRAEIVTAARALVVEEGYESAVTLRGVARRVGIAPPSIYPHFANPEEIIQAVSIEAFGELGRCIAQAKEGIEDPRARFLAGCHAYIAFGIDQPNLYGLLFLRNRPLRGEDQPDEPGIRNPEGSPFSYLVDSVRECIADGSSSATDVLSTAVQIWAALHGLVFLRRNDLQFPWLAQAELELIGLAAKLTPN